MVKPFICSCSSILQGENSNLDQYVNPLLVFDLVTKSATLIMNNLLHANKKKIKFCNSMPECKPSMMLVWIRGCPIRKPPQPL
jgi:hypothetical protein